MNIFNHVIPDTFIMGIGPIMVEATAFPELEVLYNRRRFQFDLHLVAHTTSIKSDWFDIRDNPAEKEKMRAWREQYYITRERVAVLLGEPTDQHKERMEKAHNLHRGCLEVLESLFKDLQPAINDAAIVNSINVREQRVFDNLLELKMLASN